MKSLKTERLVFRPYIKCEADRTIIVNLFTDPEVMKYVDDGVVAEEKAEALFNRIFTHVYEMAAFDIWCVFLRENSEFVCHAEIKPRKGAHDWEIIYVLKREYWGQGYATEIAQALIDYGFQNRNLNRVTATVDPENKDSIRVLEKVGMTLYDKETDERGEFLVYAINV